MLDGHPLGQEAGWLLRGFLGYGRHSYKDGSLALWQQPQSQKVKGRATNINIQIGHEFLLGNNLISLFIGPDYQRNKFSPELANNDSRGTEYGARFGLEIVSDRTAPLHLEFDGSASTANDTYWTRLRGGWLALTNVHLGPEVIFMGNNSYKDGRIGGFFELGFRNLSLALEAGYSSKKTENSSGGERNKIRGAYAGLAFNILS